MGKLFGAEGVWRRKVKGMLWQCFQAVEASVPCFGTIASEPWNKSGKKELDLRLRQREKAVGAVAPFDFIKDVGCVCFLWFYGF